MLMNILREIEDANTKLAWCLQHGDTGQAAAHSTEIHRLIEAAVLVLRTRATDVLDDVPAGVARGRVARD